MTTKKTYRRPNTTVVLLAAESSLMTISAATSDPTEGGDPTGGDNSTPNPFASSSAKMQWFTGE
ncbi:aminotransferase [Prevotella histicola]|uniref:aminotransferase n=1 Tax=Prevotella histicola TaxID=470565 RepID=UPI001C5E3F1A|nr:aminotransferase [Prevotella histicola]MBW4712499.1 aminotransferase [Prevotella histicola]MBW4877105.1 aminotransferase [Prevotella histicola]MBW4920962.1 aminotransferase [Prevotella histicola]